MSEKKAAGRRPIRRTFHGAAVEPSFASLLKAGTPPPAAPVAREIFFSAPLAHLDYPAELAAKNEALQRFWEHHRLPGRPEPLIGSPRPRGYRTTSKRRAAWRGAGLCLGFGDQASREPTRPFTPSPLEPSAHAGIYSFLQRKLSEPAFRSTARHLNYLIIRGTRAERVVIFNVEVMNAHLVRQLKAVAEHLQQLADPVAGAFIYHDPSRSDYYLESRRPEEGIGFKKLFGRDRLLVRHGGCRYQLHPTSFSQINEEMTGLMLAQAQEFLAPTPDQQLLDLYCGYGLFSHYLAPLYRKVLGIDAEGASIRAAVANCRLNPGNSRPRFLAGRITAELLTKALPAPGGPEAILLDPPRQGPQSGVIAALCRRRPRRVLHIFCGVDQLPASLRQWQAGGCRVSRLVPLDMFAGTANLEVLLLLEP